jgi:exodeoxyribonuclease VIII
VKALKAEWAKENAGREAVEPAIWARIEGMAAAILAHPLARELLTGGRAEVTVRWDDPETGLPCKARGDYWRPDIDTLVDVKTAENASPEAFAKSVANYRYHVQSAHYRAGFKALGWHIEQFVFIVVEKRAPHAVLVAMLDDAATERGEGLYREEMETMAACVESGEWPAYGNGIQILTLPRWAA